MRRREKLTSLIVLIIVVQLIFHLPFSANSNERPTYMVISFDGMRYDFTKNFMHEGLLPNFKKVEENGLFAEDIRTIYPSLTAASHAAISTGAKPEKTGMISNNLRKPGTKLSDKKSAFFSPLDAIPIWAEAKRQGKTTATVLFPGSNPEEGNQATYAIYYGTTWTASALDKLTFNRAVKWTQLPKSFSPVKETALSLKLEKSPNQKIYILAADSTDNGVVDYDTFYFSTDKNGPLSEAVHLNEWGSISFPINTGHLAGFSFKLKEVDPSLTNVKLYRTAITSAVVHGPQEFKDNVAKKFGYLPVQDDDQALEKNWITRLEYEEISEQFAKWTTEVSLYIKEQYQPDLLFFYYPQIDHEEHKYLLVDPRQPGYSKKKSKRYMDYIKWAYQLADRSLGDTLEKMNDNDRLLLVSDHGMEPVHTMISPNHELEKAGLLQKDKDGKVDTKKSKAYAVASGAIAHIYINLEGRERNGIVSKEEYPEVQIEIMDTFSSLKIKEPFKIKRIQYLYNKWRQKSHNENGISTSKKMLQVLIGSKKRPFEEVIATGNKEAKMLSHEQAGDVLLIAKQGYYIAQDEESTTKKAVERGSHGGNPERMELRPILFVTGSNYPKAKITEEISTLDIAPTLYELMDLNAPDFIDGKVIDKIIEAESN
jgi:predicted AlkP superfamily phosphohydrolase/phosphomutase